MDLNKGVPTLFAYCGKLIWHTSDCLAVLRCARACVYERTRIVWRVCFVHACKIVHEHAIVTGCQ